MLWRSLATATLVPGETYRRDER